MLIISIIMNIMMNYNVLSCYKEGNNLLYYCIITIVRTTWIFNWLVWHQLQPIKNDHMGVA